MYVQNLDHIVTNIQKKLIDKSPLYIILIGKFMSSFSYFIVTEELFLYNSTCEDYEFPEEFSVSEAERRCDDQVYGNNFRFYLSAQNV